MDDNLKVKEADQELDSGDKSDDKSSRMHPDHLSDAEMGNLTRLLRLNAQSHEVADANRSRWGKVRDFFKLERDELLPEEKRVMQPFDVEEIKALYRFVVDRGIAEIEESDIQRLGMYITKIHIGKSLTVEDLADMMAIYSRITKVTYAMLEVNGRTIRDSAKFSSGAVNQASKWGVVFFLLALVPDFLYLIVPEHWIMLNAVNSFLVSFSPFFWGGVGSSIFLLKSLSEIAARSKFDSRKLQGIPSRIFLGASLGYIVVVVLQGANYLNSTGFVDESVAFNLSTSAVGFLVGLGTKAVYGILESIINSIAEKFGTRKPA